MLPGTDPGGTSALCRMNLLYIRDIMIVATWTNYQFLEKIWTSSDCPPTYTRKIKLNCGDVTRYNYMGMVWRHILGFDHLKEFSKSKLDENALMTMSTNNTKGGFRLTCFANVTVIHVNPPIGVKRIWSLARHSLKKWIISIKPDARKVKQRHK